MEKKQKLELRSEAVFGIVLYAACLISIIFFIIDSI